MEGADNEIISAANDALAKEVKRLKAQVTRLQTHNTELIFRARTAEREVREIAAALKAQKKQCELCPKSYAEL